MLLNLEVKILFFKTRERRQPRLTWTPYLTHTLQPLPQPHGADKESPKSWGEDRTLPRTGVGQGKCCVFGGQAAGQLGWSQELPPVGTVCAQMRKVRGGCSRH